MVLEVLDTSMGTKGLGRGSCWLYVHGCVVRMSILCQGARFIAVCSIH